MCSVHSCLAEFQQGVCNSSLAKGRLQGYEMLSIHRLAGFRIALQVAASGIAELSVDR